MFHCIDSTCPENQRRKAYLRIALISVLLLAIAASHWYVPPVNETWHAVHIVLRKLFIVPVVLGAVYFGLRGAVVFAASSTILYIPYALLAWQGDWSENLNQIGEIFTFWIVAVVAGVLVGMEKNTLRDLARSHEGALVALVNALDALSMTRKRTHCAFGHTLCTLLRSYTPSNRIDRI